MSDFHIFSSAVEKRLKLISKGNRLLYLSDTPNDLFQVYLDAFPEGTNEIFRERREYDCNCCRNFINNLGRVVAVKNGKVESVWNTGEKLPYPYDVVAKALDEKVVSAGIVNPYFTDMREYGSKPNRDSLNPSVTWTHFYGGTPSQSVAPSPGAAIGRFMSNHQVLGRGLQQIEVGHLETVLDLIAENSLYRGQEFEKSVKEFRDMKVAYEKATSKELFVWENIESLSATFRNSVIGTLLVDLAEGVELEEAVKRYEQKTAPANYRRPKAVITKKMVEEALKTISSLGLDGAISRRFANINDLSVNDVLFVDNSVRGSMKGGGSIADLLMEEVTPPKITREPVEIGVEEFMAKMAGNTSISLVLDKANLPNFMAVTAPNDPDSPRLFRWSNNFAWSYDGEVADSIKERVKKAGGNVTNAALRCSLAWYNLDDLDIHCTTPSGARIYYGNRAGVLDVDMNAGAGTTREPVENLSWKKLEDGVYSISVNQFAKRENIDHGCELEVEIGGKVHNFSYSGPVSGSVRMLDIMVQNGTLVGISTHQGVSGSAEAVVEKWGVKTATPVRVQTVMMSPNHWEGAGGVGQKHFFFILEGCKSPEPVRGLYNEFLRNDLQLPAHRRVLEVLGSKTRCPVVDQQLAGVGFSLGRGDQVVAVVNNGAAVYKIKF